MYRLQDDKPNELINSAVLKSVSQVEQSSSFNSQTPARRIEVLGPFGTETANMHIDLEQNKATYHAEFTGKLSVLNQYREIDCTGLHTPITEITLNGAAKDTARIPEDATHFCWIYPPRGFTNLSTAAKKLIDTEVINRDPEFTFLAIGGFVYFKYENHEYHILRTNALVQDINGLVFKGPFPWKPKYTENLWKQDRFQNITMYSLLKLGIKYYTFINPNEVLEASNVPVWTPSENGAFVYLYNENGQPHEFDCYFSVDDYCHGVEDGILSSACVR
ncbi:unnamed protein product [Didymodactylos carnosus]|uniref:Uncharacterized protein n=1 Tax=Didymodactylos carnosus TaxID=1234261 RepID=A0A814EHU0_9BILA|nr:unnamed protein product [Didymodactylos carnosus]CAF0969539.1 unnamed protein product [Didymodactylos carnosus]CAF3529719.1 unnamed protein product [Didymodactylos carnosus]CAF3742730.1 unnamed protein product [Didymodactylos carnosus]